MLEWRKVPAWLVEALHVYVITLDRRPDRRKWIADQLPPGLRVTFAPDAGLACDGTLLTREDVDGLSVFPWPIESSEGYPTNWYERPLTVGDIGCAMSHLNSWHHAIAADASLALVIEDDALLLKSFWPTLERSLVELQGDPWDLLYFYLHALLPDEGRVSDRIVVPGYSYNTTAYLMTRDGLEAVANAGLGDALVHIDEFLPAMYCDHPRADMRERFPKRIRALAVDPYTVLPMYSMLGSDTQNSPYLDDVS